MEYLNDPRLITKVIETTTPVCDDPSCALPKEHSGFHVPLFVLWQEAGYVDGPWAPKKGLA